MTAGTIRRRAFAPGPYRVRLAGPAGIQDGGGDPLLCTGMRCGSEIPGMSVPGGLVYPGTSIGVGALRWGLQPLPASLQTLPGDNSTSSSSTTSSSTNMPAGISSAPWWAWAAAAAIGAAVAGVF